MEDNEEYALFIAEVERRQRLKIVMITLPAAIGSLLVLVVSLFEGDHVGFQYGLGIPKYYLVLASIFCFIYSGAYLLWYYLQTGFNSHRLRSEYFLKNENDNSNVSSIQKDLHKIRSEMDVLRMQLSIANRDESKVNTASQNYQHTYQESRNRFIQEIESLGRRGNLNLILGIVTTVLGLSLLSLFVFGKAQPSSLPLDFAIHFIPRLTLIIFIEVFAYFFLKLYKESLFEIKYFQNELINIEQKHIALSSAIDTKDDKTLSAILERYSHTERNHILEKGQTTIEIERAKLGSEKITEITKIISSILPTKN